MRLIALGSICRTSRVRAHIDLLLAPDVRDFGTLNLESMETIIERGYREASEKLENMGAQRIAGRGRLLIGPDGVVLRRERAS